MKSKVIGAIIVSLIVGIGIGGGTGYVAYAHEKTKVEASAPTIDQNMVMAYDWLENSGEAMSLEYQAYNTATRNLKEMVKTPSTKPKAVVLDIDETCLSNAPGNGYEIAHNKSFNVDVWNKWINSAQATPIPGAVEFTKAAKAAGVQVFYVSNRTTDQLAVTQKNLSKYGFADATEEGHVLLDPVASQDKQSRFDQIEKKYDVIMFVGDQLTDMGQPFMNKSSEQEKATVEKYKDNWGSKFIAIPDPTYGNYENAMFDHSGKKLTEAEKVELAKEGVQSFDPETGKIIKNQTAINQ